MNSFLIKSSSIKALAFGKVLSRCISIKSLSYQKDHYKLVVVGGGTGGLATSSKCVRKFGAGNVAIIEPSKFHYYQPGWTLAGGGIKKPEAFTRNEEDLIPKGCDWINTKVNGFDPENNTVILDDNKKVNNFI